MQSKYSCWSKKRKEKKKQQQREESVSLTNVIVSRQTKNKIGEELHCVCVCVCSQQGCRAVASLAADVHVLVHTCTRMHKV